MFAKSFLLVLVACLLTAGCQRVAAPVVGRYLATVPIAGHDVPFHLDITQEDGIYVVYLVNGDERIRAINTQVTAGELVATLSGGTLRVRTLRKALRGTLQLNSEREHKEYALNARLGETRRFFAESLSDNADIEGRWDITLTTTAGQRQAAIGVFEQAHDRITGTVTIDTDQHHIEGQVRNDEVRLSSFSGSTLHLYRLRMQDNELNGEYRRGSEAVRKLHAARSGDVLRDHQTLNAFLHRSRATS